MPPLPQAVLKLIEERKFVNFDNLLPANSSPLVGAEYSIQVASGGNDPSLALVPRNHHTRPRVIDFLTWMTAWNNFVQAMMVYHPDTIPQLIAYQTTITSYSSQYTFSSWSNYDQTFRYKMVNSPSSSWEHVDMTLFNLYILRGTVRISCALCNNFGHMSADCPLRATHIDIHNNNNQTENFHNVNVSASPHHQSSSSHRSQPLRAMCRFFNDGRCTTHNCQFRHECQKCFGNHPQSQCKRH